MVAIVGGQNILVRLVIVYNIAISMSNACRLVIDKRIGNHLLILINNNGTIEQGYVLRHCVIIGIFGVYAAIATHYIRRAEQMCHLCLSIIIHCI